jgi:hypothetical protein
MASAGHPTGIFGGGPTEALYQFGPLHLGMPGHLSIEASTGMHQLLHYSRIATPKNETT